MPSSSTAIIPMFQAASVYMRQPLGFCGLFAHCFIHQGIGLVERELALIVGKMADTIRSHEDTEIAAPQMEQR